jgi:hypothetical protein
MKRKSLSVYQVSDFLMIVFNLELLAPIENSLLLSFCWNSFYMKNNIFVDFEMREKFTFFFFFSYSICYTVVKYDHGPQLFTERDI